MTEYAVVIEDAGQSYSAYVPDLLHSWQLVRRSMK